MPTVVELPVTAYKVLLTPIGVLAAATSGCCVGCNGPQENLGFSPKT